MKKNLYDLNAIAHRAMLERGFIPDFSPAVRQELDHLSPIPVKPKIPVVDLRHLLWFSIDNDDSLDLDQITFARKIANGGYLISIAIALVDQYVKIDTAIDRHACHNTTSVYTPTKKYPMLPDQLSTDLTSLNAQVERLAVVFEGEISSSGVLEGHKVYLAQVYNHVKLAYDATSAWLDGGGATPPQIEAIEGMEEQIKLQDEIAHKLASLRHMQGALSLETIEPETIVSDGVPVDIRVMKKNRGRLLIENFMIVANMISARFAEENRLSFIRRVVTIPRRWDKIIEIATEKGTTLPPAPDAVALEKFLLKEKAANPEAFPDLSLMIVKLLGRGEYKLVAPGRLVPGHFGLAVRDYTHSTAPNRRYPDLIVQRIILATLEGNPSPYTDKHLEDLAFHCTEKENDADKVERRMRKSAAALMLSDSIGQTFDGIITGASEQGTWVRIFHPPVEGKLLHLTKSLDVGERVHVKLVHTDVLEGFIDFVIDSAK